MGIKYSKLEDNLLNEFRILVRKALFLEHDEEKMFYSIPENVWAEIFKTNFNSELTYAKNVILGGTDEIVHTQTKYLERVKRNIDNFDLSVNWINEHIDNNQKVIFITDFDNDGSMSQTIIKQLYKILKPEEAKNVVVEYARSVANNNVRGFSYELVKELAQLNGLNKDDQFLIVTADNGINSRDEQIKINKNFPNAKLLITDHHNPTPKMMVVENENTAIFNPHYFALEHVTDNDLILKRGYSLNKEKRESYDFFKEYNISGASTVGLLISDVIKKRVDFSKLSLREQVSLLREGGRANALKIISDISRMSNMVDYVKTAPSDKPYHFKEIQNASKLQTILNVNNSVNTLITKMIDDKTLDYIKSKSSDDMDIEVIKNENKKIMSLNIMARGLLSLNKDYPLMQEPPTPKEHLLNIINQKTETFSYVSGNPNYIEQLRPLIFELTVDDHKTGYQKLMLDAMLSLYDELYRSERNIVNELRKSDLLEQKVHNNSTISIFDKNLRGVFNRKLLNKAYNSSNNGFYLSLDNISDQTISGSFRSLYDISDILTSKDKRELKKEYNITIETPGHERAAGFIIRPVDKNQVLDVAVLGNIGQFIDQKIETLKNSKKYMVNEEISLVTDAHSLNFLSRFNTVIRGNVSHFARITPLVKLDNENLVWTNPKTGEQLSLVDKVQSQKYGWINIQTGLPSSSSDAETLLIPSGVLRNIVNSDFQQYLKVNFLNTGVFIGEQPVTLTNNELAISLEKDSTNKNAMIEAFKDGKLSEPVQISRNELKDNPFFSHYRYADSDFEKFEQTIIEIIDSNNIDTYSIFDVEADGFGFARLLNIGFMNYQIDEDVNNGITFKVDKNTFDKSVYQSLTGQYYFATPYEEIEKMVENGLNSGLRKITKTEFEELRKINSMNLLIQDDNYFVCDKDIADSDFLEISNHRVTDDGFVICNRTIKAETIAFLIKPDDFIISPSITKLTGIDNELAQTYGLNISEVDQKINDYFKDKVSLFIAHNTEYDGRIVMANLPLFNNILNSYHNLVADSAAFSKENRLMYNNIDTFTFMNVPELDGYYFYGNPYSKLNFGNFITNSKEGEFPDLKNRIHIVKKHNNVTNNFDFYVRDMKTNTYVEIKINNKVGNSNQVISLLDLYNMADDPNLAYRNYMPALIKKSLPLNMVGYKAQGLGEMRLIRQLLLDEELFDIKLIEDFSNYPALINHSEKLISFQKDYRFNQPLKQNFENFIKLYPEFIDELGEDEYGEFVNDLRVLIDDFTHKNVSIENKYNDSWYYQSVLKQFQPELYTDLNKTNYELISTQTGIPEDLVKEVLQKAYEYKQKYKVAPLANETHMNGPYKGQVVGDVAYEDKATMLLLIDAFTNKFGNDVKDVVNIFNDSQKKYHLSFLKQGLFSDELSNDSMSYKQHRNYHERDSKTYAILHAENREQELLTPMFRPTIVKFKLSGAELQTDKHVYAITNVSNSITSEDIEEDAKKIAFIVSCQQIGSPHLKNGISKIYEENMETMLRYREELSKRYIYMEINNSIEMINGYLKVINQYLNNEASIEDVATNRAITKAKRSNAADGLETISKEQLFKVNQLLTHFVMRDLLHSGVDRNEVLELSRQIEFGIFNNKPFKDNRLKGVAQFYDLLKDIQYHNNDKLKNSLDDIDDYISKNDHVSSIDKLARVLIINSFAINYKLNNPSRLEIKMMEAENDVEKQKMAFDNGFLESSDFLDSNHSLIKRRDTGNHLMENMNYMDLAYQSIYHYHVEHKMDNLESVLNNKTTKPSM